MSRIEIKNVGPIRNAFMEIENGVSIVIGEQASGKSTLAKEVYFFKKIRDYFLDYLCEPRNFVYSSLEEQYLSFLKYLRSNYMESFGTTKHLPKNYQLEYVYSKDCFVTVKLDRKSYANIVFSKQMTSGIKDAIAAVRKIYNDSKRKENNLYQSFLLRQNVKEDIAAHFKKVADVLFDECSDIVYIPAGRSMLSVLSEQMDVVDVKGLDLPMRDFVQRIRELKPRFGKKLDEVVADYLKTVKGQIKNKDVELGMKLIKTILRGDYVSDNNGEKVYIDSNHWVKLIYSSSGQQETLWILNFLFLSLLENRKTFFIIEEPEAHLFPYAQRTMIELIALTHNSNGSQMFITTHSPYILSSTNLLIHSGAVENRIDGKDNVVVDKKLRLSKGVVAAYRFQAQEVESIKSIIDKESGMILSGEIDGVSDMINEATDILIKKEMDNGLL